MTTTGNPTTSEVTMNAATTARFIAAHKGAAFTLRHIVAGSAVVTADELADAFEAQDDVEVIWTVTSLVARRDGENVLTAVASRGAARPLVAFV